MSCCRCAGSACSRRSYALGLPASRVSGELVDEVRRRLSSPQAPPRHSPPQAGIFRRLDSQNDRFLTRNLYVSHSHTDTVGSVSLSARRIESAWSHTILDKMSCCRCAGSACSRHSSMHSVCLPHGCLWSSHLPINHGRVRERVVWAHRRGLGRACLAMHGCA